MAGAKTKKQPETKELRKLPTPQYKSFRLQKRIKAGKPKLPSAWKLYRETATTLWGNKRFFALLTVLYGVLSFILVQNSVIGTSVSEAKTLLVDSLGALPTNLTIYAGLIGTSTQFGTQTAAIYQFIILFILGLAIIYGLRHMYGATSKKVTVKESLYKGMAPLIPVLLVMIVITLQFLPLSIGTGLYATVVNSGLAVTNVERIFWVLLVLMFALLTLYLISSSLFALFIVTLPDMKPVRALRSARELVRFRRLEIIRKLILLPVVLSIALGVIVLPFIAWLPGIAQIVFFVVSLLIFPVALTYMYNLYRSML